jgi:hypothetical protein
MRMRIQVILMHEFSRGLWTVRTFYCELVERSAADTTLRENCQYLP